MYMHIYINTKMFKISINCFSILLCCVTSSGAGRVAQWLSACSANSGFKSSVPPNSLKGNKCHKQIPLSNINMLFKFSPLQCLPGRENSTKTQGGRTLSGRPSARRTVIL